MYSQILTSHMTFNRTRQRKKGFIIDRNSGEEGKTVRRLGRNFFIFIVAAIASEFYIPESNVSLYEFSPALILSWQFVCDHSMLVIRLESGD